MYWIDSRDGLWQSQATTSGGVQLRYFDAYRPTEWTDGPGVPGHFTKINPVTHYADAFSALQERYCVATAVRERHAAHALLYLHHADGVQFEGEAWDILCVRYGEHFD